MCIFVLTNRSQSFNVCKTEAEKGYYMLSHEQNELKNSPCPSSQWHFSITSNSISNKLQVFNPRAKKSGVPQKPMYCIIVLECKQEYTGAFIGFSVSFGGNKHIMKYCVLLICSQKSIMLEWKWSVQNSHGKSHYCEECCSYLHSEHEALHNSECKKWTLMRMCTIVWMIRMSCELARKLLAFLILIFIVVDILTFYLHLFLPELLITSSGTCTTNSLWCEMLWKFFSRLAEKHNRKVILLSSWKFLAARKYVCVCVHTPLSHAWENNDVICM